MGEAWGRRGESRAARDTSGGTGVNHVRIADELPRGRWQSQTDCPLLSLPISTAAIPTRVSDISAFERFRSFPFARHLSESRVLRNLSFSRQRSSGLPSAFLLSNVSEVSSLPASVLPPSRSSNPPSRDSHRISGLVLVGSIERSAVSDPPSDNPPSGSPNRPILAFSKSSESRVLAFFQSALPSEFLLSNVSQFSSLLPSTYFYAESLLPRRASVRVF